MEKRIRMWLKACLIIAGLLFFCFLAGRRERGTDYEKEARIRQYEADESVEKIRTTLLACGEMIQKVEDAELVAGEGELPLLVTTDGVYTYETEEAEDCIYKQVTAYIRDDCVLEVVEEAQQEDTVLSNLWISEVEEERILCFLSGNLFYLPFQISGDNREQVADVILKNGAVTDCTVKKEKVSGKLIGVTDDMLNLPGKNLPVSDTVRVYRLYGELAELSLGDLPVGYENTDM